VKPEVSPEARLLTAAVRARLLGLAPVAPVAGIDWEAFVRLAQDNRLLLMAAEGMRPSLAALPSLAQAVDRYRAATLCLNGAHLTTLRKVTTAFAEANIDVVVIKGPAAQYALYGDYFIRPSTDIDLLVAPAEFARAGAALERLGYELPAECRSPWWRIFLGEQHFLTAYAPPVDLHHRTQQPGSPSPRAPSRLLREKSEIVVGAASTPVLSPRHACLLSCMSVVKAISAREACAAHVCDIVASLRRMSSGEVADLVAAADKLGLRKTLLAGFRAAHVLFGAQINGLDASATLAFIGDSQLAALLVEPEKISRPPMRTRLLWSLSAGPFTFARELAWKAASDLTRNLWPGRTPEGAPVNSMAPAAASRG
jgi:hypothetical protein